MLVIGFVANLMVRPVNPIWHMSDAEVADELAQQHERTTKIESGSFGIGKGGLDGKAALFWLFVGIPLAWGIWTTVVKALGLFA